MTSPRRNSSETLKWLDFPRICIFARDRDETLRPVALDCADLRASSSLLRLSSGSKIEVDRFSAKWFSITRRAPDRVRWSSEPPIIHDSRQFRATGEHASRIAIDDALFFTLSEIGAAIIRARNRFASVSCERARIRAGLPRFRALTAFACGRFRPSTRQTTIKRAKRNDSRSRPRLRSFRAFRERRQLQIRHYFDHPFVPVNHCRCLVSPARCH